MNVNLCLIQIAGDCHTMEQCWQKRYEIPQKKVVPKKVWRKKITEVVGTKEGGSDHVLGPDNNLSIIANIAASIREIWNVNKEGSSSNENEGMEAQHMNHTEWQEANNEQVKYPQDTADQDRCITQGGGWLSHLMDKLGFWNVRGLNSPNKHNKIKWFLNHYSIGIFSLLETKVKVVNFPKVLSGICSNWSIVTNLQSHKEGVFGSFN